ncbi:MAG: short-chain fatty acyl-CoA regulator family protein [Alphaproteobacteria bacterium]
MPARQAESQPLQSILGARIRQRRRELGLSQAELARRVGISASYLNLIEWNKRQIAGTRLRHIAEALDLELGELDGAAERRLLETLTEVGHLPELAALGLEDERIGELIGRFPGWARGLAAVARSQQEATARAQMLSDRLSNDPFLGETVHRMLTRIAAIRSAAEILTEYPDVPADRRERFHLIVHEESRALSDVGEALAAYLDKAEAPTRTLTPVDEVEALFDARGHHFAEIEAAAAPLTGLLVEPQPVSRHAKARTLAETQLGDTIDELIAAQPEIETAAAGARARRALADYAVGAILMPLARFVDLARASRYDLEALAAGFAVDVAAVCRRLTNLPRAPETPRFGYLRANAAGTIIEMLGLEGLAIPRYAAACPLWVLYRAQQSPEAVIRQRALFPSGARFVFVARARNTGPTGFGKPRHYLTDMITMSEADAQRTVYAADAAVPVEEVGPSCRLCPRRSCPHRVDDPLTA